MTGRPEPFPDGEGPAAERDEVTGNRPGDATPAAGAGPSAGPGAPIPPDGPAPGVSPGRPDTSVFADFPSADQVILDDLGALAKERDEYLTALQHLQADFENYRKRVTRQQEELSARAAGSLVAKLLPVLDAFDLAAAHLAAPGPGGEPSVESQALTQARALLVDALAKEGLERVDEVGVVFDPVVHDAVAHAPAGEGDGAEPGGADGEVTVDDVLRAGYRWRGQVLRPAMVRVRG